jgi:hypothetical protein
MKSNKPKPIPKDQRIGKKERVFSTNFPDNFNSIEGKCFVPWEDFVSLKKRYIKLHKRYMRRFKND